MYNFELRCYFCRANASTTVYGANDELEQSNEEEFTNFDWNQDEENLDFLILQNSMSEVDLYALEAKFNDTKAEYIALMNVLQTSCFGNQSSSQCQKAAELNASMQNSLLQMSNLIKKTPRSLPKQQELLNLSGQLELDQNQLVTELAKNDDLNVLADMNREKWLAWWLSGITVFCLIMYARQK